MMAETVVLASRRSRLARAQALLAERAVIEYQPRWVTALLWLSTTGDRQADWSLEEKGGKGLFTKEIEEAVRGGEADLAVHSAKDLPTAMPEGLELVAFLPRADPADVLVLREGVANPETIATGSPRRRAQLRALFPGATFTGIRGNVETRLRKIREGEADATVLAAAGLARMGLGGEAGLVFRSLRVSEMIPAAGQAAIALQGRAGERDRFAPLGDPETERAVLRERAFLRALGGGCHTAFAGFSEGSRFHAFHEEHGRRTIDLPEEADADRDAFFRETFADWR
ncbi:MAG: hydroxymethylbilane synthase [Puniceicoccaceae bacterium]